MLRLKKIDHFDLLYFLLFTFLLGDRISLISLGGFNVFPYQALTALIAFFSIIYFKKIHIPLKIFFIYSLIIFQSCILLIVDKALYPQTIIKENIQLILLLVLSIVIYNYLIIKKEKIYSFINSAYTFWIISGLVFVLSFYLLNTKYGVFYNNYFPYPRATGFNVDPNVFGIYLLTFLPIALYYNRLNIKRKIIYILISTMMIVLTFSRTNTILIFVFILLYCVSSRIFKHVSNKEASLLIILVLIASIIIISIPNFREAISLRIEQLLLEANVNSDSRFGLWSRSIESLKNNIILGVGIDHPILYINKYIHNTFLEILMSFGVVGIFIILFYIYNLLIHVANARNSESDFYMMFAYIFHFISISFVSLVTFEPTIILFTLSAFARYENKENKYEKDKRIIYNIKSN